MIINTMKLNPFAGITEQEVAFEPGLNVILGPNEAGKSTLLNALRMVLFMPTNYGKRISDRQIIPFMPLSGGDTITVNLNFRIEKDVYNLSKSWGNLRESKMRLPGGGLLADAQAVQDKLQELLVLKEGTFNSVLFADQSGLTYTFDSLSENSEASEDLASVLRKAVFETDGVSIEQLSQIIEDLHDDYFSRWDISLKRPEGHRGVENPWIKSVGKILKAYYDKEKLKQDLNDIRLYEEQVEHLIRQIRELSDEITTLNEFVDTNRPIVDDARLRQRLEAESKALQEEQKSLREISRKWPTIEQEIKSIKQNLSDLEGRQKALTEEMRQAEAHESSKRKLEKYERSEKKRNEWEKAKEVLRGMKAVEKEDYESLETLHNQFTQLETSLEAGKLALTLTAKKATQFRASKDFEEETTHEIKRGQSFELSAGGQIQIRHEDWILKVKSGEIKIDDLLTSFNKVSKDYNGLLKRLDILDFASAKELYEAYKNQCDVVASLKTQFEEILDGDAYEELEALSKTATNEEAPRSTGSIGKELGTVETKINQGESDIEFKTNQLQEWEKDYKSQDHLLDLLVEKRADLKDLNNRLQKLKPLPPSVKDPDKFIQDFEEKQEILKEKGTELSGLLIQQAGLEARAPEETQEEMVANISVAEHYFEQVEMQGEAIKEIRDTFLKVKTDKDSQTLNPWLEELGKILEPLTVDRYKRVNLVQADLGKAVRTDGLEIPFDLLSIGTKVGLGLALRLSMARYFLESLEGFLVLDDPLVDMDPERQEAAAKVIQNFAREKQILIATCHPIHADLLGGHTVVL